MSTVKSLRAFCQPNKGCQQYAKLGVYLYTPYTPCPRLGTFGEELLSDQFNSGEERGRSKVVHCGEENTQKQKVEKFAEFSYILREKQTLCKNNQLTPGRKNITMQFKPYNSP